MLSFLLLFIQLAHAGYDNKADGFYLKHFAKVNDNVAADCFTANGRLYRGGVPDLKSDKWITRLKEEGVQLVVDLRNEGLGLTKERQTLEQNNIRYILVPLKTTALNSKATVELLKKTVAEVKATSDKVYIHCQRGEDRTGVFMALYRNCPLWKKEFKDYGGVLYPALSKIMYLDR